MEYGAKRALGTRISKTLVRKDVAPVRCSCCIGAHPSRLIYIKVMAMKPQEIELKQIQLPIDALTLASPERTPSSSRQHTGRFLKGPVPLDWLQRAAQLPGKSLHVGIAIWFLVGLQKSSTVQLKPSITRQFGIDRHAGYRALKALEKAELITVSRHRGRSPMVTVI